MDRRAFLGVIADGLLAAPLAAEARGLALPGGPNALGVPGFTAKGEH